MWPHIAAWIDERFMQKEQSRIITMPADSGLQENQILEYIMELELKHMTSSPVKLLTYDDRFDAAETGIKHTEHWRHTRCSDIFKEMVETLEPMTTLVWFDMCGPLAESTRVGMLRAMPLLSAGSVLFVTLQVHACRLQTKSLLSKLYRKYGGTAEQNISVTTVCLQGLASPLEADTIMVAPYRRRSATFCVFGFKLAQPTQQPTEMHMFTTTTDTATTLEESELEIVQVEEKPKLLEPNIYIRLEEKKARLRAELAKLENFSKYTDEMSILKKEIDDTYLMLGDKIRRLDELKKFIAGIAGDEIKSGVPEKKRGRSYRAVAKYLQQQAQLEASAKTVYETARDCALRNAGAVYQLLRQMMQEGKVKSCTVFGERTHRYYWVG